VCFNQDISVFNRHVCRHASSGSLLVLFALNGINSNCRTCTMTSQLLVRLIAKYLLKGDSKVLVSYVGMLVAIPGTPCYRQRRTDEPNASNYSAMQDCSTYPSPLRSSFLRLPLYLRGFVDELRNLIYHETRRRLCSHILKLNFLSKRFQLGI